MSCRARRETRRCAAASGICYLLQRLNSNTPIWFLDTLVSLPSCLPFHRNSIGAFFQLYVFINPSIFRTSHFCKYFLNQSFCKQNNKASVMWFLYYMYTSFNIIIISDVTWYFCSLCFCGSSALVRTQHFKAYSDCRAAKHVPAWQVLPLPSAPSAAGRLASARSWCCWKPWHDVSIFPLAMARFVDDSPMYTMILTQLSNTRMSGMMPQQGYSQMGGQMPNQMQMQQQMVHQGMPRPQVLIHCQNY